MPKQEPLPWYMVASLAMLTASTIPHYVGLVTRTKIWCWLSGKCEYGAAHMPSLLIGAVVVSIMLSVVFYAVVQRKMFWVSLLGGTFLLVFALMTFSMALEISNGSEDPTAVELALLTLPLLFGISHLAWVFASIKSSSPETISND